MSDQTLSLSRRKFLALSGATALSLTSGNVLGANDRIRIAIIGCGRRTYDVLFREFFRLVDVEIVAICDPDTAQMDRLIDKYLRQPAKNANMSSTRLNRIKKVQDYRHIYERDDIDAVIIAAPNHWHALHAIQAMESGKDVYLEKPLAHTIWEGQQLIAAQQQYPDRILGAGFQNRSDPGPQAGIQFVQEGNLGKILSIHSCCLRNRKPMGAKLAEPLQPPSTCDYNLWLGPAQDLPIYRPEFHYDWHWMWNTGNGEAGNIAPHEIDMICWLLGDGPVPQSMQSFGGRMVWDDAGQTPNMLTATYEQAGIPITIEVNDLKLAPDRNVAASRFQVRWGIVVKCEGGELRGGRYGMYAVGEDGKTRTHKFPGDGGKAHPANFIAAIRSRKHENLASPWLAAARSSAVAHLANASFRHGKPAKAPAIESAMGSTAVIPEILNDQKTQLAAWGVDDVTYQFGPKLTVDPDMMTASAPGLDNALSRPMGRGEFLLPDLTSQDDVA